MDHNKELLFIRIESDFTYHPPTEEQVVKYNAIRTKAKTLALLLAEQCPYSRELSLALTHLESVVMFANAAIARNPEPEDSEINRGHG